MPPPTGTDRRLFRPAGVTARPPMPSAAPPLLSANAMPPRSVLATAGCLLGGLALGLLLARRPTQPQDLVVRGAPAAHAGVGESREIERLRRQLREARCEADAAHRARDDCLAMLSHELRNPLGAIASAAEVLQRVDGDPALAARALEIVVRQTGQLSRIMNELQDVARVVSGDIVLAREPVDLAGLVQRVVDTARMTGTLRRHPLSLVLEPAWVTADRARIDQVATHLLANALKHTPAGSGVRLSTRRDGAEALLVVEDDGPGIAAPLLPRVFSLFVQGERGLDRRGGGLGIGLTLVRRLTALHGGRVAVDSSERGTAFHVRLPAIDPPPPPAAAAAPAGAAAPRSGVLVEDNGDAAQALRVRLELDGHRVRSAADGVEGLDAIVRQRPDVAIVDLGLPGLTGLEVARRSRAAGYPGLMIATSGYGQPADARRSFQAGFDAHLVKPIDASRLRELMARQA